MQDSKQYPSSVCSRFTIHRLTTETEGAMKALDTENAYPDDSAAKWRPMGAAGKSEILLPPCRVCGDKASGFHYGANTCEACKVTKCFIVILN